MAEQSSRCLKTEETSRKGMWNNAAQAKDVSHSASSTMRRTVLGLSWKETRQSQGTVGAESPQANSMTGGEGRGESVAAASDAVIGFYTAINARDVDGAMMYISDDCSYEDMIYSSPFSGEKDIASHFQRVVAKFPPGLKFVIDDITDGSSASSVGLTWHLELDGKAFPFSRGCSFYRLTQHQGRWKLSYGRDIVEPFMKPGNAALNVLGAAAFLMKRLRAQI